MPAYFIRWPGYVYQEWSCKTGKREGPPQFGGMEKGGDWLASKGLGFFFSFKYKDTVATFIGF